MNDNPIISIIIPAFNVEKYIDRIINSILNQTYSFFEVIVVDDGSKDSTALIVENINDARVKLYKKENGGVSSARNYGIKKARGKYLCFFDSDDTVELDTLEKIVSKICDCDCLVFCYRDILPDGRRRNHYQKEMIVERESIINDIFFYAARMQIYSPCNKLYSKVIIEKNNLKYEEGLKIGEDYLFNLSFFENCNKVVFINDVLYNYYQNDSSAINSFDVNMWEKQLRVVKETYNYKKGQSEFEKEFIVKRIVFLYRYYSSKGGSKKMINECMVNFYNGLVNLDLINNKKCSFVYNYPYKLLINKRFFLLNRYISLVNKIVMLKQLIKGK